MFKWWRFIRLFKSRHRDTWVPNFNIFFWSVQRVSPPKLHNIYPIIAVSLSLLKFSLGLRCEWLTQFFISRLIAGSSRVSHSSYQIVNGIFRQEPQERVKREFCESFSLIRYKQIDMRSQLQLWRYQTPFTLGLLSTQLQWNNFRRINIAWMIHRSIVNRL